MTNNVYVYAAYCGRLDSKLYRTLREVQPRNKLMNSRNRVKKQDFISSFPCPPLLVLLPAIVQSWCYDVLNGARPWISLGCSSPLWYPNNGLEKLKSHVWGLEEEGSHLAFTYSLSIHMKLALSCANFSPFRWPSLVWIDLPLLLASVFARALKRA
jgi:hypothetical protein